MGKKGSLGTYTPKKPSWTQYIILSTLLALYATIGGYVAGREPTGEWRYFSWHPFLMMCGMIGMSGISAMTKKLGGYTATLMHSHLSGTALLLAIAGVYFIYQNKERNGTGHLKSAHGKVGFGIVLSMLALGTVGGLFLHPDYGLDRTNKTIRLVHKSSARLTLIASWVNAFVGLFQLVPNDPVKLAVFALPLVAFVPFVLM